MTKSLSAHRRTNNRGLTLVEVLVIVSILGMLTAIALPAVNRAREAGRRNTCTNNFRQFGTALVAFEATHGVYPSANSNGPYFRDKPKYPKAIFIAPHVFLLPHLDLNDLYQSFEIPAFLEGKGDYHRIIDTEERVSYFRCPSDPENLEINNYAGNFIKPGNNIRVSIGTHDHDFTLLGNAYGPGPESGAFDPVVFRHSGDIADGISRTVAASEKLLGSGIGANFDRRRDYWYAGVPWFVGDVEQMVSVCDGLTSLTPPYFPDAGLTWSRSGFGTTWYNHAATPNAKVPDCHSAQQPVPPVGMWSFSPQHSGSFCATSNHPGGVNVVFLDAHTEFVINDVELPIWRAMGTIAGAD